MKELNASIMDCELLVRIPTGTLSMEITYLYNSFVASE